MTIFDFKPYSYWRQRHRQAHDVWLVTCGDTPRTTLRLELQELIIAHQNRLLTHLARDNQALRTAHQLVLEEYLKLHAASMELHRLVTQTIQNAPNSHETDVLRPDAPASTPTHEIEPLASVEANDVRLRLHPAMTDFDWKE